MTWNVSMPNCTDIKWYAFVLHIHARFYGVKLSSLFGFFPRSENASDISCTWNCAWMSNWLCCHLTVIWTGFAGATFGCFLTTALHIKWTCMHVYKSSETTVYTWNDPAWIFARWHQIANLKLQTFGTFRESLQAKRSRVSRSFHSGGLVAQTLCTY